MKRPEELRPDELAAIVARLQTILYLDEGEDAPFWNRDKEWRSVDMLIELADVLEQYDLVPNEEPRST